MKDEREEQKKLERKMKRAAMKEGAEGGDTNKAQKTDRQKLTSQVRQMGQCTSSRSR